MHGFQIWLNLPAAEKMKPAAYQELLNADITEQKLSGGGIIRVIAGEVTINQGPKQGPLPEISTRPVFMDAQLPPNETVELCFSTENTAMVYVYKGATDSIASRQLAVYASGSTLQLKAGPEGAEFLVLSGQPINEPLVQYGPFVMNTQEEIERALADFQSPKFLSRLTSNRKAG